MLLPIQHTQWCAACSKCPHTVIISTVVDSLNYLCYRCVFTRSVTSPQPCPCRELEIWVPFHSLFSLPRPPGSASSSCLSPPVNLCLSLKNHAQDLLLSDALLRPAGRVAGSLHCVPRALWRPRAVAPSTLCLGAVSRLCTQTPGSPSFSKLTLAPGHTTILLFQPSFFQSQAQTAFGKCLLNK